MKLWLLHTVLISGILLGLHAVNNEAEAAIAEVNPPLQKKVEIYRRPQLEKFIISFTNQVRSEHGLTLLDTDQPLVKISRSHSDDMIIRNYTGHVSPEGMTPEDRVSTQYRTFVGHIAENIWVLSGDWKGAPYNESASPIVLASRIVDEWMQSPAHRKNILTEDLSHIGVGVSVKHGKLLVTQLLAYRLAVLDQPLVTKQEPSTHINLSLIKERYFDEYQYCFETLNVDLKKQYVSMSEAHRAVKLPNKKGIYRLIVLVKLQDDGDKFYVYAGPIIVVDDQASTQQNILSSLHPFSAM